MDKDIKEILENNSKDNMPDLWGKIESKLYDKKKRNKKRLLAVAAIITVVFSTRLINSRYITNNDIAENKEADLTESMEISVIEDLDLDKLLADKVMVGGLVLNNMEYSDIRTVNYDEDSYAIVYGKVKDVKSYVSDGSLIISDINIEVIEDYKNNLAKGETITIGSFGGEVTYEEFISKADENIIWRNEYDKIEDKSKMFIQLDRNNIPQYRKGEYVLVYLYKTNKETYYSEKDEMIIQPPSCDYGAYIKQYVNPNTKEVYEYKYDYEKDNIIKENITTLDEIGNWELSK